MSSLSLSRVGAWAALATVACFVAGIALTVSSGVEVLIPETGAEGREWIADVESAGDAFFVGAWLAVFGGLAGVIALVGFYDALRSAGQVVVLAPIAAVIGMTLVTISHVLPVAMAYELAPGYAAATASTQASLDVTADTLASLALLTNYVGNALGWGLAVPIYAWAVLKTGVVARWIGWVGIVTAVFAGWLGLLGPAWSVLEGLSSVGFVGFFVFLASMGVALLRRRQEAPVEAPAVPS